MPRAPIIPIIDLDICRREPGLRTTQQTIFAILIILIKTNTHPASFASFGSDSQSKDDNAIEALFENQLQRKVKDASGTQISALSAVLGL
mgnify:CR=1 FL=1